MNKKIWILGILVLCILLLFNTTYEGFESCLSGQVRNMEDICVYPVKVKNTPLRTNKTCSDPSQIYIYDKFDGAVISDSTQKDNIDDGPCTYESKKKGVPEDLYTGLGGVSVASANYDIIPHYYGMTNLCLPNCPAGFTEYQYDSSLCISADGNCHNTPDLSSNILDSWRQVCGPLTKTEHNLTSTINSISNVTATIDKQFDIINSNVERLGYGMYEYNGTNTNIPTLRDARFPNIMSNYEDLNTMYSKTNNEYSFLKEAKSYFDNVYKSYYCDRY